jgi:arginyl-tRNA synthetase
MHKNIQEELTALIRRSLKAGGLDKFAGEEIALDFPTDERFGDFTTNIALKLSKELKSSPRQIALGLTELIEKEVQNSGLKDLIAQVKVEGAGFINFYLNADYFYAQLGRIISTGREALKQDLGKARKY